MFTRGAALRTRPHFAVATDPIALPGGALIVGFSAQSYNWICKDGPMDVPEISEMLVQLQTPDGTPIKNQGFFEFVHANGQQREVDEKIIPAAIDFAVRNRLIGPRRQVALNMFPGTASRDFFIGVKRKLDDLGLPTSSLRYEGLEYESEITKGQVDAFRYAVEDLGFSLALDDLDPRVVYDRQRIEALGPYADVFKLSREVMRDHRNGIYPDLPGILENLRYAYPAWVVAEGVPRTHQKEIQHMQVDATQSWWGELVPQAQ